jgi:hypothetical protein
MLPLMEPMAQHRRLRGAHPSSRPFSWACRRSLSSIWCSVSSWSRWDRYTSVSCIVLYRASTSAAQGPVHVWGAGSTCQAQVGQLGRSRDQQQQLRLEPGRQPASPKQPLLPHPPVSFIVSRTTLPFSSSTTITCGGQARAADEGNRSATAGRRLSFVAPKTPSMSTLAAASSLHLPCHPPALHAPPRA